jgi:SAM-dependent methyltransferase
MEAQDYRHRDADRATASPAIEIAPLLRNAMAGRAQPTGRRRGALASAPGKATIGIGTAQCGSEYVWRGEYHRELDKNWPYFPVYVEKLRRVRQFLQTKRNLEILDVGCGEGVLVDEYRRLGYDITGLDLNFSRSGIVRGSVLQIPFVDDSVDVILCLDVLEHLNLLDQPSAIAEIRRVLKPGGVFLVTIPNLAHFASRLSFFLLGKLIRTSGVERHPGDRPYSEYRALLSKEFVIERSYGLFPTYPLISLLTYLIPSKVVWLHRLYNTFCAVPGWCFLSVFECRKASR